MIQRSSVEPDLDTATGWSVLQLMIQLAGLFLNASPSARGSAYFHQRTAAVADRLG